MTAVEEGTEAPGHRTEPREHRTPWIDIVAAWVVARVVVGLGFGAAQGIATQLPGTEFLHLDQGLLTWDASWYASLAEHGYAGSPHEGLRFFPLYHLLAQAISFGTFTDAALLVISNGCALVVLWLLHRLVVEQFGDERLARRSVWLMALFPAAGAFVFAYSESLMLALTLGMYLLARRDRWWWVALLGVATGLCRPVALLLCLPFAVLAWESWRRSGWGDRLARLAGVAGPAVGVAAYLAWVQPVHGSWRIPIDLQRDIRKGVQDPFTRLWDAARHVLTDSQLDAPALGFAVLFIVLTVWSVRRQPVAWWLYSALTVVVAVSAPVIDSTGRYGLVAFPLVVALAQLARSERSTWAALALSSAGLLGLTTMTLLGGYIP